MKPSFTLVAIVCAWWTAYGLVAAGQQVQMAAEIGQTLRWSDAVLKSLVGYWSWVPLTLGLVWWVSRCPLDRQNVARWLGQMTVAVAVVVILRAGYVYVTDPWFHWYQQLPSFWSVAVTSLGNNFMLVWLVIGAAHAFVYVARAHRHELQVAALEASLARARLDALTAQLNPHFLFNTLNAAAELVHHDADGADRMLVGLSELLRHSLAHGPDQEVRLSDELALLRQYLEIQQLRMGERLRVQWAVDETCLSALVPVLVLQPLVENAIIHGIARRETPGSVCVQARREAERLIIDVTDDGAPAVRHGVDGVGLSNTRARLECLHGAAATLDVSTTAQGGTRARLALPIREQPDAAPAAMSA